MKYELFRTNWIPTNQSNSTDIVLPYCVGSVLNLCSGKSTIGNLRIDLLSDLNPDIVADIMNLPIRKGSFDTVILDPPYSYFGATKWLYPIADIAKKRIIISSGQVLVRLKKFKLIHILAVVTTQFFVRLWYIYDKVQDDLTRYVQDTTKKEALKD